MTSQLHFYDSANPRNVPSGVYAGCYVNGYAWPESEADRMRSVFWISVHREAYWAKYARCIDVENGAAQPSDVPAFIRERYSHGFNDATVYVNRSNWEAVYKALDDEPAAYRYSPFWWVSTLDGTQYAELTIDGKVVAKPWAVQYYGGMNAPYDISVLHGLNNFVSP